MEWTRIDHHNQHHVRYLFILHISDMHECLCNIFYGLSPIIIISDSDIRSYVVALWEHFQSDGCHCDKRPYKFASYIYIYLMQNSMGVPLITKCPRRGHYRYIDALPHNHNKRGIIASEIPDIPTTRSVQHLVQADRKSNIKSSHYYTSGYRKTKTKNIFLWYTLPWEYHPVWYISLKTE